MLSDPRQALSRLLALPGVASVAGVSGVWAVGGAVRDAMLGRVPAEVDLLVEGDAVALARGLAERHPARLTVHERFGTASLRGGGVALDLASTRTERYPSPGALPEVVLGADVATDLARRDVTVNAIALRLEDGAHLSVPHALEDLRAGQLRVLHGASFRDDPTRALRVARYAARLGMEVEPGTLALLRESVADGALRTVSAPRLGAELRLMLEEPQPVGMVKLHDLGLAEALHPDWHPDADVLGRALALRAPDAHPGALAVAEGARWVAPWLLRTRLDRLGLPADVRERIVEPVERAGALADALPGLGRAAAWERLSRERPETVALAGALAVPARERVADWLADGRDLQLQVSGSDLIAAGLRGPAVGEGLRRARAAVAEAGVTDREGQLAAALAVPTSGEHPRVRPARDGA